ncbi:MAG: hypothetical protein ACXWYO_04760 [Gaiellaceae bacterium]
MVGNPPQLICNGFVEADSFVKSKADLIATLDLTDRDIDDRLAALMWGLNHDAEYVAERIPGRILWVAITDWPPLRIFMRPSREVFGICELLWIEEIP